MNALRGRTAVVGTGLSPLGEVPGWTQFELMARACERALRDANVGHRQVDGVFAMIEGAPLPVSAVCEYLGLRPRVMDGTMIGGASFVNFLAWASLALHAGECDVALILYGSNARSARRRPGGVDPIPYEAVYGANLAASYALAASRHMHVFGTTREQLAHVPVAARHWARLNPEASRRDPLTIDDVLAARRVADPFGVHDCCLISDGAGAVVMVRAERAADHSERPAYLLGVAAEHSHQQIAQMDDLTTTAARRSGERAYRMAGCGPADVDVAMLYDAFSINTLLFLEDLGFCPKGEGGPFVASGAIAPGGALPVNTNGGGLSCVHPGMYGIFTVIETVVQLQGRAGARQVPDARIGLSHGNGGALSAQVTALFGTRETV